MKQIKLRPTKVKVMGKVYKVAFVGASVIDHENFGQCDHNKLTIAIQDYQLPVEEADTLFHEITHAIWYQMGVGHGPMEEEPIVHRLASGWTQVFLDNPELLKYFSAIQNKE